jgi:hypothetical protein
MYLVKIQDTAWKVNKIEVLSYIHLQRHELNIRQTGEKVKSLHLQEPATQQKKIIICNSYKNKKEERPSLII